ncbi:MAG: DUF1830 domain-containing protein [Cyanobacteria bacterium J06623_7]
MTQIFFPPQSKNQQQKTYCYVNNFPEVVVVKLGGPDNRHCERVIFPTEKFLFVANDSCELEIHRHTEIGITRDIIACAELTVVK